MATTATPESDFGARSSRRPGPSKGRRWLFVVLGLLLVVGGLAALKGAQIASLVRFGKKARAAGPPPETVSTTHAVTQTWNDTLSSVGSVTTAHGVTLGNDLPGIVSRLSFESGATVKKGQVLAELDTSVERAELASARARLKLAATNVGRTRTLAASGSVAPAELDTEEAQFDAARADVQALTAQIEKKTIRAPFAGKLGIRLVNVGQYLPPGTPITVVEATDESSYVDFSLPQQAVGKVAVGMPVRLSVEGASTQGTTNGRVFAVEPVVDPTTRNIRVRATLPEETTFRPGMFVDVEVVLPHQETVVAVPAVAVVHASYGDSVFIVEDGRTPDDRPTKVVRQQFVKLGQRRGDFVALRAGVKSGEEIVTAGAFKLRNRAPIVVNDAVKETPELSPHPENR
ncbi:MAG TPA: efflux RND transporter periplasmic adaptor subunit [Polyangiaceae bacterium]|nr:efflux RND transporter periplasmic adaptor subunit [Polyangiaceae bacterium]